MGGECPSRGGSKCKGPEAATGLSVQDRRETDIARAEIGREDEGVRDVTRTRSGTCER